jgi:alanyl-tRNA synthetase
MTAKELRQKYLDFFKSKGHEIIPSASVVPQNDPTTLFITAGMHPLVPYLMGESHPLGKRLANSQKSIRTIDIDEVGDPTHHTFFEMLGNWSLGDYFKKEAIEWSWEFLTSSKWLNLDRNRIAVSVFEGDSDAPFDQEAHDVWINLGVSEKRIARLPKKNNWWGPAGETGPCGPDSEMFYWVGDPKKVPESFNDDNALWVEIWNDVFMEYNKNTDGVYEKLAQQNVDTGMGLVRTLAVVNGLDDNYKTELFWPIVQKIEELSGKKYDESDEIKRACLDSTSLIESKRAMRIIADHIKASVFIIADGIEPSNVQRGYVLRRLIRRAVRQGHILGINNNFTSEIAKIVQEIYKDTYPEINNDKILEVLNDEEEKFRYTLDKGLKEFDKLELKIKADYEQNNEWTYVKKAGEIAFDFYQTYGFPIEMFLEELEKRKIEYIEGKEKIIDEFKIKLQKHQELSRTASAGMFKGGLADTLEKTTQLHTTAHLMLAGLRKVLGNNVHQKGSNINGERLRFDFSHPEKMTDEQKKSVEDFVNEAIKSNTDVILSEMTLDEAKNSGAEGEFEHKYGDKVKVYTIGEYSKEICGGPHVKNTSEIKGVFKIKKEESSSAGVRRIKAVVE